MSVTDGTSRWCERTSTRVVRWIGLLAALTLWWPAAPARAQGQEYTFSSFVGSDAIGATDGTVAEARFRYPRGVAVAADGTIYVADTDNSTIRRISADGQVTTLAGEPGQGGSADGTGSAARFAGPQGVAVDGAGTVYVADTENHTIRRVSAGGEVTTLAGSPGLFGSADGSGTAARFYQPTGVAVDTSGVVYVADHLNHTIRRISTLGEVTTFAGRAGYMGSTDAVGTLARFRYPRGVAIDAAGVLFVADGGNHTIRRIAADGAVTTYAGAATARGQSDGTAAQARFDWPHGVAVDTTGTVFVADYENHTIRKITPERIVSTIAGSPDVPGEASLTPARFRWPHSVAAAPDGSVVVADVYNHVIRRVSVAGAVSSVAGLSGGEGFADGTGGDARFLQPQGLSISEGVIYVADSINSAIRRVSLAGDVTTLATGPNIDPDKAFGWTFGIAANASAIYFTNFSGSVKVSTLQGVVGLLAGWAGFPGSADGTGVNASFRDPMGAAVGPDGNIFIADSANNSIRMITPAGVVTTLAGTAGTSGGADGLGPAARFTDPSGVAVDGAGNVYVADTGNHTIRKITPDGVVSTLAGLSSVAGSADGVGGVARFRSPLGVAADADGIVYVADTGNQIIRRITQDGTVTTIAGMPGAMGSANGTGSSARFAWPAGVTVDEFGTLYVADLGNHKVRRGVLANAASPVVYVAKSGEGVGLVSSAAPGISCGTDCTETVASGTEVVLTAVAEPGSTFDGWSGGGCSGTATCSVTPIESTFVTARFSGPRLVVALSGGGSGTVTSDPAGITCGTDCESSFVPGSQVTLTATPGAGSAFAGWSGAACPGTAPCVVTAGEIASVTATFLPTHAVSVTKTGTGTITSSPAGISCGADCSEPFAQGTLVALTATPGNGWVFQSWAGACAGTPTPVCTVTVDAVKSASVTFAASKLLTIWKSGSGTITSSPGGIDCGADCTEQYAPGTSVTLTAVPDEGSVFSSWNGGGCTGTGPCTVPMNTALTISVTFGTPRTLTVTKAGTGAGTVTSAPTGISCGSTCSGTYSNGTRVTLTAAPATGSSFGGWSNGCTGTGTCSVTLTAAANVTATFNLTQSGGATYTRYLAEGATSTFFDTRLALVNPGTTATTATITYLLPGGTPVSTSVPVPSKRRVTVDPKTVAGLEAAEFSTTITAPVPLVVDRTMSWDVSSGFGAHAETAIAAPASTWYLAEGATHSGFNLFYLIQNPNDESATVRVRYLLPTGTPLEKTYTLDPMSRRNIWVDVEEFDGLGQALASTDVSAVLETVSGHAFIVERAMYLDVPGQTFGAGHESAGITAPATEWFLAEGATGGFFDLFVLVANPSANPAEVDVNYSAHGRHRRAAVVHGRRQQPVQHLGRLRGSAAGRYRRLDDGAVDQ